MIRIKLRYHCNPANTPPFLVPLPTNVIADEEQGTMTARDNLVSKYLRAANNKCECKFYRAVVTAGPVRTLRLLFQLASDGIAAGVQLLALLE